MGKLLKRFGSKCKKFGKKVLDKMEDGFEDLTGLDIDGVIDCGKRVGTLSRDVMDICDDTKEKRTLMVAFGEEISTTLHNFENADSSILETIKSLTAGEKVEAAMEIAKDMDKIALACVEKSLEMVECVQGGLEALPDSLEKRIAARAEEDSDDDDEDAEQSMEILESLDRDIKDVEECVEAVDNLNLVTAMEMGVRSFTELTAKTQKSETLFTAIRDFASNVQDVSQAFKDMDARQVVRKISDMLDIIQWSDEMKMIATAAGKLIKMIIQLFKKIADRISVLWGALAYAKDCVVDCIEYVKEACGICETTQAKSLELIDKSTSVKDKLEDIGDFDRGSIDAIKSLKDDGVIQESIDLACSMDDLILECSGKVIHMVDRMQEGIGNLPDILTDGIVVEEMGSGQNEEPEPADVETDIEELIEARTLIDSSNIISAGKAGVRGFKSVSEKTSLVSQLLDMVKQFTASCDAIMASFLGGWDVQAATRKITEMCNLINIGKLMKQFAEQIKKIILSIIDLLKSALEKFTNGIADLFDAVMDKAEDLVDGLKDKLCFWK